MDGGSPEAATEIDNPRDNSPIRFQKLMVLAQLGGPARSAQFRAFPSLVLRCSSGLDVNSCYTALEVLWAKSNS
jgi:hypothetical protein